MELALSPLLKYLNIPPPWKFLDTHLYTETKLITIGNVQIKIPSLEDLAIFFAPLPPLIRPLRPGSTGFSDEKTIESYTYFIGILLLLYMEPPQKKVISLFILNLYISYMAELAPLNNNQMLYFFLFKFYTIKTLELFWKRSKKWRNIRFPTLIKLWSTSIYYFSHTKKSVILHEKSLSKCFYGTI